MLRYRSNCTFKLRLFRVSKADVALLEQLSFLLGLQLLPCTPSQPLQLKDEVVEEEIHRFSVGIVVIIFCCLFREAWSSHYTLSPILPLCCYLQPTGPILWLTIPVQDCLTCYLGTALQPHHQPCSCRLPRMLAVWQDLHLLQRHGGTPGPAQSSPGSLQL